MRLLPKYLRIFAENQPITQVIEAIRSLLIGKPLGNAYWIACAWCIATLAVCIPLSAYLFRRRANQ
jgi:ABC-2 type transport system permease protein